MATQSSRCQARLTLMTCASPRKLNKRSYSLWSRGARLSNHSQPVTLLWKRIWARSSSLALFHSNSNHQKFTSHLWKHQMWSRIRTLTSFKMNIWRSSGKRVVLRCLRTGSALRTCALIENLREKLKRNLKPWKFPHHRQRKQSKWSTSHLHSNLAIWGTSFSPKTRLKIFSPNSVSRQLRTSLESKSHRKHLSSSGSFSACCSGSAKSRNWLQTLLKPNYPKCLSKT